MTSQTGHNRAPDEKMDAGNYVSQGQDRCNCCRVPEWRDLVQEGERTTARSFSMLNFQSRILIMYVEHFETKNLDNYRLIMAFVHAKRPELVGLTTICCSTSA